MSLLCKLKNLAHKGEISKKDLDRIRIIPKDATNGNVMLKLFPNSKYKIVDNGIEFKAIIDDNTEFTTWFPVEWWNAPYVGGKKEQPKQIAYDVGGHTYGVIGGDEIMKEFEG